MLGVWNEGFVTELERKEAAIKDHLWDSLVKRNGEPGDPEERQGLSEEMDRLIGEYRNALIDIMIDHSPKGGQLPQDARTKIRGGYFKYGWNQCDKNWVHCMKNHKVRV